MVDTGVGMMRLEDEGRGHKPRSRGHQEELKKAMTGSSRRGSALTTLSRIHKDVGSIPGLTQWIKDPVWP